MSKCVWFWMCLVALGLIGCGPEKAPAAPAITPAGRAEAEAFAAQFVAHVQASEKPQLAAMIDDLTLARRGVAGRAVPEVMWRAAGRSMADEMIDSMCETVQGGSVTLLRVRGDTRSMRAIVRLIGEQGFNYMELELGRAPGAAAISVVDVKNYVDGELSSVSFGRLLETLATKGNLNQVGPEAQLVMEARTKLQAGDAVGARAVYARIPEYLRKDRSIRMLELEILDSSDLPAFAAAFDRFAKDFPDGASLALMSLDRYLHRKEFARALEAIDTLDKAVEGDPYLDVMRANTHLEAALLPQAIAAARRAIEREPTLQDARWSLLTATMRAKDYPSAIEVMNELTTSFQIQFSQQAMLGEPEWSGFLASAEGKRWLSEHAEAEVPAADVPGAEPASP